MRMVLALLLALAPWPALAGPALDPAHGAVLSVRYEKTMVTQCSRASPRDVEAAWTPGAGQIHDLEARLPAALARFAAKDSLHLFKPAADFIRQYVGIVRSGRKLVYVNAYPLEGIHTPPGQAPFDWRHELLMGCGGGAEFFGVEYDPQTGSFAGFAYNGA